ncbi:KpsF/GutQ family sugar-phosphate isomerase [Vibrio splendidus]|uniref:KpsF/GutQ family sugar-phosphate isomerase n=1 Tax=Vibrio splendidus TaxID=29497 RepID=UPI002469369F|nr:KpsF/GutQ family sugar-phosphate isomerase [Vibrio splendidus]MDH5914541.1 KpsF/GutQ family sugar-phosphate isomerase [Vibrio splendidus]MDH5943307.1 KpsF/GutQ family sugar-phosphate isomerase [Vibrio splendidus]MDH5986971.1 KpsF/GutQ family sugar-phosphate isomerase [Vibrio splendidus]MDH5995056.1 KpsF/GutQ family sugar-phosphate isomerase [Vibrio splendidus]MDH6007684.1 KpsF/GutQ family sugar-phosphate isomerase [Vibrio splendidus]
MSYILEAKSVIRNEIDGILEVESKLDESFESLISAISNSSGRVVMCGMGKSGHIAKKIFATLVSTGTPSMYMHPAEAFHGDLGMIKEEDIFFAISNSGETAEVTQLLPFIKNNGNTLVSMTGNPSSTLASVSDFHIDIGVKKEACPLNLAPTTSTTVSLVLGDAIAIALMTAKCFKEENFAKYHPGGSLGRKLLMTVKDSLTEGTYVREFDSFIDVISTMSTSKTGTVLVGSKKKLLGIITDGDIRKYLTKYNRSNYMDATANKLMTRDPKVISSLTKCGDADKKMFVDGVNSLIVKDGDEVLGIYDNLNRK